MLIDIPSFGKYEIKNLIFDYNGTIGYKGELLEGLKEKLVNLSESYNVYIVTADTYGTVRKTFEDTEIMIEIIKGENEAKLKAEILEKIGKDNTISFGNGRNDVYMLMESAVGIGVIGKEGMASSLLQSADILVNSIFEGISLIENKKSLIATLRR